MLKKSLEEILSKFYFLFFSLLQVMQISVNDSDIHSGVNGNVQKEQLKDEPKAKSK